MPGRGGELPNRKDPARTAGTALGTSCDFRVGRTAPRHHHHQRTDHAAPLRHQRARNIGSQQPERDTKLNSSTNMKVSRFSSFHAASMSPIQGKVNWGTSADSSNRRTGRRDSQEEPPWLGGGQEVPPNLRVRKNYLTLDTSGRTTLPTSQDGPPPP